MAMSKEIIKANMVVFIASFCTLVIELVAGRIMAPYVGVSLYTWTSIIGVVLAGISIGAYVGGLLADRFPSSSTLGWLLFLSGLGAFSISPLINLIGAAQFQTSLMMRIVIITTAIFFVPSCLLGMISPVVVKLTLDNLNRTGNIVGKIYAFSTLGSIIGTFATGFYLIQLMGTRKLLFTVGAILIVSALIFGGAFIRRKKGAIIAMAMIPLIWVTYTYGSRAPIDRTTYIYKESDYFTIQVKKHPPREGSEPVEALVLDHLVHSLNNVRDPMYLDYEYLRIYEEVVRWHAGASGRPFKSLFIGGGGYTFPRFLEARYPGAGVDVVEIDPEVTKTARLYLGVPDDTRIKSYNEDGRWFVMNCREKASYDFIFGDAFNDISIPYHLTTVEFNRMCAELLKPDGILMTNIIDSFEKGLFMPAYIRTLEEVFGKGKVHILTISPERKGISTCVIVASRKDLDLADFARVATEGKKKMSSNVFSGPSLQQYLQDHPSFVLTDDYVPVDNLTAPIFEERFGYRQH
jgi:spermidine synthase